MTLQSIPAIPANPSNTSDTVHFGNCAEAYAYFMLKMAYAWETGNAQLLADLYRYFQQRAGAL